MIEVAEAVDMPMLEKEDSERFADLVHEHARVVFAVCMSVLRNRADAEDASQDCFLRLIRYRYRLWLARDKRAFVARVAQRCALDRLRRRAVEVELEDVHAAAATQAGERESERAALARAIRSLPEELRRVIELAQTGELTSEQMGRVLGIPAATARSRLARAKSLMREKLERRVAR